MRRLLMLLLAAGGSNGCALLAEKTPTPAAELRSEDLRRLPTPPGERYYLMVFGSEDAKRSPPHTHTWATVVRVAGGAVEPHTISWMPATLEICPFRFSVEPGRNLDLDETMRFVLGDRQRVAVWGPFEVSHASFVRFTTQKTFLESGAVGYQDLDCVGEAGRTGRGCNCIHAVTDMDPEYDRGRYPLAFYGIPAAGNLVRRLMRSPIVIDPPATHDWVLAAVGLDQYPYRRRHFLGRPEPYRP